jgi:hypothetical protein
MPKDNQPKSCPICNAPGKVILHADYLPDDEIGCSDSANCDMESLTRKAWDKIRRLEGWSDCWAGEDTVRFVWLLPNASCPLPLFGSFESCREETELQGLETAYIQKVPVTR